jgi:hypothetical protein
MMSDQLTHFTGGVHDELDRAAPNPPGVVMAEARFPQKMGYKNVRSMAGGFKAWKAAGLPTTT